MKVLFFLKVLQIMGFLSSWSVKALEDGKVTLKEGTELLEGICNLLGIPLELDIGEKTRLEVDLLKVDDELPDSDVKEETGLDKDVTKLNGPSLEFEPDQ